MILNNDCLYNILYWLDLTNLVTCFTICKQFTLVSKNEMLWQKLYCFNIDAKVFRTKSHHIQKSSHCCMIEAVVVFI